MSALVRYPTPRAGVADAVNASRLSTLRLDATVPPTPVVEFFVPKRAPRKPIQTGEVGKPRLYFRLEPTIPPTPNLEFMRPQRTPIVAIETGDVGIPRLYFKLGALIIEGDGVSTGIATVAGVGFTTSSAGAGTAAGTSEVLGIAFLSQIELLNRVVADIEDTLIPARERGPEATQRHDYRTRRPGGRLTL